MVYLRTNHLSIFTLANCAYVTWHIIHILDCWWCYKMDVNNCHMCDIMNIRPHKSFGRTSDHNTMWAHIKTAHTCDRRTPWPEWFCAAGGIARTNVTPTTERPPGPVCKVKKPSKKTKEKGQIFWHWQKAQFFAMLRKNAINFIKREIAMCKHKT